jgi:hypothetical protein
MTADPYFHFHTLDHEGQAAAIHRLAILGYSDYGIAQATRLAVAQVRRVLAERVDVAATQVRP